MDVLSFITTRGVLTLLFFWFRLRGAPPARSHTRRERIISIALGLMFSANIFALLLAIQLLPLSIAILTYFIYPLLTGFAGAATGIDRVEWRGLFAALAALIGLAMMLGARLGEVAPLGIVAPIAAAVLRVVSLLVTRASLRDTDFAAEHMVFAGVFGAGLRTRVRGDPDVASAAVGRRVVGVRRREHHQYIVRADDLRVDRAHRSVPNGADHEPGAARLDNRQRRTFGRSVDTAAGDGRYYDADRAVRLPVAPMTYRSSNPRLRSASRIRSRPRSASASFTRLKHCCVQSIALIPCSRWKPRIVAL